MIDSQKKFYHLGHISAILLLLLYFILMFIERSYIKNNDNNSIKLLNGLDQPDVCPKV